MAKHGKAAQLFMGSTELSTYFETIDRSLETDSAEVSVFGRAFKEYLMGLSGQTLSVSGHFDGTIAATLETAQVAGTAWTWKYFPGGSASGQRQISFSGFLTNLSDSSPVGDKVSMSFEVLATGTVTSTTL